MQEPRVAARYAKSLLDLAQEKNILEKVKDDMEFFLSIADKTPQLKKVLENPVVSDDKKKNILDEILEGKVNEMTMAMFSIILRKNRANYLYYIAKSLLRQYKVVKGIQTAEVTTTYKLSPDQEKEFVEMVKKISGADKVDFHNKVDESIIGGYILRVGDRQIDESVKSKLTDLKNKFYDSSYIVKY